PSIKTSTRRVRGRANPAPAVETRLFRLVVLVEAGHDPRVPAEQLLCSRRLPLNEVGAERADIVHLLVDERAGELMVDRQSIPARRVRAGGMPQRRVEHDHRPAVALDWNGVRRALFFTRPVRTVM